jgi:DNA-binding NarL/FixJ family response regulator
VESLREANRGGAPMSPEIARLMIEVFRKVHPPEKARHNLTPKEFRLLKLFVEGHSYKTAAAEMAVSI